MSKSLFKEKRFFPFFITQFFGAFNDNVFKNILIIILTYQSVSGSALLVNLSALLFILPFFLFSSLGGQIGDKYEKSALIKKIKLVEVLIMVVGAIFFMFDITYGLMAVLFLMGTQSAVFGPVKYSLLPQHLKNEELLKGNAYVETGTFIAILLGTIYAGFVIQLGDMQKEVISVSIILFSIIGYLSSRYIPEGKPNNAEIKLNYNIFAETKNMFRDLKQQRKSVSRSIFAISWFWFMGAVFLTQLPTFSKEILQGDENAVILLLTLFSIGIGCGSILSEKLSDSTVELGLVPVGAFGLTVSILGLYFSAISLTFTTTELITLTELVNVSGIYGVFISLFSIGVFGGIYTVPLYTLIQLRTADKERSRVIATNNVSNSLFMSISAVFSIVVMQHFTVIDLFLSLAIINVLVAIYIFTIVPEFTMRFLVWFILKFMYRIKTKNINIPMEGRMVIISNHVGFMDSLVLSAAIKRPVKYVMHYKFYNMPILHFIFKHSGAIPIAGRNEDRAVFDNAFNEIEKALLNDEALFIFPEGMLTRDGEMNVFKSGIEHIIKRTPAPVYPVAIQGLWGSFFSKKKGTLPFKRIYSKVTVVGGERVEAIDVNKQHLETIVRELRGDKK